MPLANLPMTFAVHGRHQQQRDLIGDRDVLDVGVHARAPLRRDHRPPRDRLEGHAAPTKRAADARHHGDDVVAALLQAAAHLDRLVGADAAGDAERDERHGSAEDYSSSIFSTFRRSTSRCAMVIFLPPVSRGSAPASSWRARLPAIDDELETVFLRWSVP